MDHNRLIKMDLIVIYSFQLLHVNFFSLNNNNRRKKMITLEIMELLKNNNLEIIIWK